MSHSLPPMGHPARDLFDVQTLVDISTGREPVRCNIWELRTLALRTFASNDAIKRVAFIRVRPDNDNLELVTFGRRGAWKREWTFGPITRTTRIV